MSDDKRSGAGAGVSFTGLLTILFIGLKLTGYIDWSWWWVLSPIWLPVTVALAFVAVLSLLGVITERN